MSERTLKPLKDYRLCSATQTKYIPILDSDPVLAARALTKKDIEKSYKLLKKSFEEISVNEAYHEPIVNTILFSQKNFLWFSSMLKEFERILGSEECEIPFEKCPDNTSGSLVVYPPYSVYPNKGKYRLCNVKTLSKELHPINNHRIKYIIENFDMSEFINDCYPAWYLLKDTTVFEQYSEKTNTRVRVDFKGGEFSYFIAGASDNWQKIEPVPIEMDHVIAALIFRSYID
jgi:hypothetical protein